MLPAVAAVSRVLLCFQSRKSRHESEERAVNIKLTQGCPLRSAWTNIMYIQSMYSYCHAFTAFVCLRVVFRDANSAA